MFVTRSDIKLFLFVSIIAFAFMAIFMWTRSFKTDQSTGNSTIRFVPLGDSYTIGEGVLQEDSWPVLLTKHLQQEGVDIKLVDNLAVTGYTTQDVIERELPIFTKSKPTFTTLLIGANDWAGGMGNATFRRNLERILDTVQKTLPNKQNIILITIPDFSLTPRGKMFGDTDEITKGIQEFNEIIKEEGVKRSLVVVDLFSLTQSLRDESFIVEDGLHPSGRQYVLWEEKIFPIALKILKK